MIEVKTHNGGLQRDDVHAALYALLSDAEDYATAARSARLAADDDLADFLCMVQEEIVGEAERLLEERVAE